MKWAMRTPKNTAAGALVGIWAILLVSFVIAVLSVGKEILIPIALEREFRTGAPTQRLLLAGGDNKSRHVEPKDAMASFHYE